MRHFALLCALVLLSFAMPAAAQGGADPANFLPATVSQYFELSTGHADLEQLRHLLQAIAGFASSEPSDGDILDRVILGSAPGLTYIGIDSVEDIISWTGENTGVGFYYNGDPDPAVTLVFPISDTEGAQTFVDNMIAEAETLQTSGLAELYDLGSGFTLAISDDVIWLGTLYAIEQSISGLEDGTLADADWYNNVKNQLPAYPLVSGYVNGEWVVARVAQQEAMSSPDVPSAAVLMETILRIHPAESAMEEALLQFPPFIGAGFAMDYADGRLDVTGAAVLDATYPAPTLTTETAGVGLLDVIPADSVLVFDTYDASVLSGFVGYLALIGPAIGNIFDEIVSGLQNPGVPTPTPTPTPTPLPPPTADDLIAQAQPIIQQAESMLGISLEELYSLINGELAIALFPSNAPLSTSDIGALVTPGFALYLQTSDTERLLEVIDKSTESFSLLMNSPFSTAPAIQFEIETIDGVEVTYVGVEDGFIRAAYGILDGDILFVTIEPYLETVLDAAGDDTSITQTRAWHNDVYESFGTGQEALLFLDISKYLSITWSPYNTATPPDIGQLLITTDFADNGVFLLHAAWLLEQ